MSLEVDQEPDFLWLTESDGFAAWGRSFEVDVGMDESRFERAWDDLSEAFGSSEQQGRVIACGSFTFDPAQPGSLLFVPTRVQTVPESRADGTPSERVRYAGSSQSDLDWLNAVAVARSRVQSGALSKVVLARDVHVWAETPFDIVELAHKLNARFSDCFTFACAGLVGASPELLVRKMGDQFESVVLAGSAPRSQDAAEDSALGHRLLESSKDRDEHRMAVDSVTDVLDPVADGLLVGEPVLLRLPNIQHLCTHVSGWLRGPLSSLQLVGLLHPTAAVGGTPRAEALSTIRELEGMERGRYCGPVGWVDAAGDGEWAIALRCGDFQGARGRLFAGAGIVAESVPELELEETRLKLRAIQGVLGA